METSILNCPWEAEKFLIFSSNIPNLLYYSHIPAMLVSLALGIFVFFKNKNDYLARNLFLMGILFFVWGFFDLILWATNKTGHVMFFWSMIIVTEVFLYIASLFLTKIFLEKKTFGFYINILLAFLLFPLIILTPGKFNLVGVNNYDCNAIEGFMASTYGYVFEIFIIIWIIILFVKNFIKNRKEKYSNKQYLFFFVGIIFFLFSFSWGNLTGSFLENRFGWELSQYGLFGMPVFMGLLGYLIVRYKAFDIKLLGAQALVTALVVIIGSELFFAESFVNQILILITLAISLGFGYMLIKSIKNEVQRKEELQKMSDKLAQANDQLRKLDNAKTEFISIASHQLRTPLTAIKGFISLLLEGSYGKLQKEHEEVLNKVYASNERLIVLVEDLLNISRIESGRMEYQYEKWNMEKMCSEIMDTFMIRAKERGLYLDYKKPEKDLPEVVTDGKKLREVVSNLVDNALKYSQRGGVSVRLSAENGKVQVAVSDTGIGIPKEELPYLFSKFSRGKDTSRLNTGGTGLGLYVGKSMVEAMGGKIWAESEGAGKGSKFIVEVPVEREESV